jgi:hypothetical protein
MLFLYPHHPLDLLPLTLILLQKSLTLSIKYQRELLALKQAVINNAAGIQTMKWGIFF